jgi:MFS family permease
VLAARAPAVAAGRRPWSVPAEVARPALTLGLASFGYGTLNGFLVLRFDDADLAGAGIALGLFGAAFVLCRLLGSRLVDRVAAPSLMLAATAVEAAGLAAIAVAPGPAVALAGVTMCGAGTALVYPALANLVAGLVAPARRGVAVGALTSSWDAGLALGGVAGGAIVPLLGLRGPFAVAAALAAVAALPLRLNGDSPPLGLRPGPRGDLERGT